VHIDGDELALSGVARDLVTEATHTVVVGNATVHASVDEAGNLASLSIEPAIEPASADGIGLVGRAVAGGFRDAVRAEFPHDVAIGSPLALLLDDLPVASLISGYARLYSGTIPAGTARAGVKSDICSGWRSEGTMMTSVRRGTGVPVTLGPTAPPPTVSGTDSDHEHDVIGWHHIEPLPVGSMRRRRMVDVHVADDRWWVNAMFRDTHVQPGGNETVLHEYTLTATIDASTRSFLTCSAVPRVLPFVECPVAAASADRLVGQPVDATRDYVRRELRGISTCTHLNDLLRSLGDVGTLTSSLGETFRTTEAGAQR
jgi:hypothetical protein